MAEHGYIGICTGCGRTFEGGSCSMIKLALLYHTQDRAICRVETPYEIDAMVHEKNWFDFHDSVN